MDLTLKTLFEKLLNIGYAFNEVHIEYVGIEDGEELVTKRIYLSDFNQDEIKDLGTNLEGPCGENILLTIMKDEAYAFMFGPHCPNILDFKFSTNLDEDCIPQPVLYIKVPVSNIDQLPVLDIIKHC